MKVFRNILYIMILLLLTKEITAQQLSQEYNINSQELAYEKAIQFTGYNSKTNTLRSLAENKQIVLKTLFNENLPLKGKNLNGDKVWEISFPDMVLDLPNRIPQIKEMQIKKTFKVTIDAKTGSLIKIIAQQDTTKTFFYNKKSKLTLENELGSKTKYLEVTTKVPKVNMIDALTAAIFSCPMLAEEIHMTCVLYDSEFEDEVFLAWCITSNNIKGAEETFLGPFVHSVVNATTGEVIRSGNHL